MNYYFARIVTSTVSSFAAANSEGAKEAAIPLYGLLGETFVEGD
jgi:hypothetical protein